MVHKPLTKIQSFNSEDGFTLVELMVVIVIIGLLATVVVINVLPSQDQAMVTKAKSDVHILEQSVEMYKLDNRTYPTMSQGLRALVSPPVGLETQSSYRKGGYVHSLPKDPWGSDYIYIFPNENDTFEIISLGADKREGGEGINADISNRKPSS